MYKRQSQYDVSGHIAECRDRHRGEPTPRPETDEYIAYRRAVLVAGGLDDEGAEPVETAVAGMSPQEHYDAMRRS